MIVSAWNPAEVEKMALPPCHALFQFYVADGKLVPAVPAFLRHVPRRAVQHRLLLAAHHDDGAADRAQAGRIRLDRRRLPMFTTTTSTSSLSSWAASPTRTRPSRSVRPIPCSTTSMRTSRSSATSITPLLRHLLRSDADYHFVDSEDCEGDGPRVFAVHYTKAQFRNPGGVSEMEHDSSRSGYHEPEPGSAGLSATRRRWG